MAKMTKEKLKEVLTSRLGLTDPIFRIEKASGRWVGNIISPTFKGKRDHARQKMIWDALAAELGAESVLQVGMLLAYTPDEWHLGQQSSSAKVKKAG